MPAKQLPTTVPFKVLKPPDLRQLCSLKHARLQKETKTEGKQEQNQTEGEKGRPARTHRNLTHQTSNLSICIGMSSVLTSASGRERAHLAVGRRRLFRRLLGAGLAADGILLGVGWVMGARGRLRRAAVAKGAVGAVAQLVQAPLDRVQQDEGDHARDHACSIQNPQNLEASMVTLDIKEIYWEPPEADYFARTSTV